MTMTMFAPATHLPIPDDAMCWRRTFPGRTDQARPIRQFTAFLVADVPCADDAVHAAAEFFCNAIQHSRSGEPGGIVTMEVRRWCGDSAAIMVTDQGGPDEPRSRPAGETAAGLDEHGRGLQTVAATAKYWGWWGNNRSRTVLAIFTA
jgi:serine/threonine-protein kinase RsbW